MHFSAVSAVVSTLDAARDHHNIFLIERVSGRDDPSNSCLLFHSRHDITIDVARDCARMKFVLVYFQAEPYFARNESSFIVSKLRQIRFYLHQPTS